MYANVYIESSVLIDFGTSDMYNWYDISDKTNLRISFQQNVLPENYHMLIWNDLCGENNPLV